MGSIDIYAEIGKPHLSGAKQARSIRIAKLNIYTSDLAIAKTLFGRLPIL